MTNRIGPNLPEPTRGGRSQNTPDSEKFGKEMKKVEKIEKVGEVELDKRSKRPFYEPPAEEDEEVENELKAEENYPTPYEPKFHAAPPPQRMMMMRSSPPPKPPVGFEDLADKAIPSVGTSAPPKFDAPTVPQTTADSNDLPQSESFWEGLDIPYTTKTEQPPQFQEQRRTGAGVSINAPQVDQTQQRQERSTDRNDNAQLPEKKKKADPFAAPPNKKERKEDIFPSIPASNKKDEKNSWLAASSDEVDLEEGKKTKAASPSQKVKSDKGPSPLPETFGTIPTDESETSDEISASPTQNEKQDFSPGPASPASKNGKKEAEPFPWESPLYNTQNAKEGEEEKGFIPLEEAPPPKKKDKKSEKESPWQPSPPIQGEGKASTPSKENEKERAPKSRAWQEPEEPTAAPILREAKKREPFAPPKPSSKKESEEAHPVAGPWVSQKPPEKDKEKKGQHRMWEEDEGKIPIGPPGSIASSHEQAAGEKKKQKMSVETVQPPDPLPPLMQEIAQVAQTQASPYLNPQTAILFAQMVGTIVFMASSTPGIVRTEITLNSAAFVNSKFYNTTIIIEKYATAPDSFNIRLTGSPEAVKVLNNNIENLAAAFAVAYDHRKISFRIGRIEASYAPDRPLIRRKKESGEKDDESGDFERGKR